MPFATIYRTNQRTNPWNFRQKYWELGELKISVFLSRPFWFFFWNFFFFCLILWETKHIEKNCRDSCLLMDQTKFCKCFTTSCALMDPKSSCRLMDTNQDFPLSKPHVFWWIHYSSKTSCLIKDPCRWFFLDDFLGPSIDLRFLGPPKDVSAKKAHVYWWTQAFQPHWVH